MVMAVRPHPIKQCLFIVLRVSVGCPPVLLMPFFQQREVSPFIIRYPFSMLSRILSGPKLYHIQSN